MTVIQALKECEEKEPGMNEDIEALQAQLAAQEHLFQVLNLDLDVYGRQGVNNFWYFLIPWRMSLESMKFSYF